MDKSDKPLSDDADKNDDEEEPDDKIFEQEWYGEDKAVGDIVLSDTIKHNRHIVTSCH